MKRTSFLFIASFFLSTASAQELFPYTEPASNMPSNSISIRQTSMFMRGVHSNKILQRHMPEVMLGINKKFMIHAGVTISDMHEEKFIFESLRLYAKYRFLSLDDVHKHFRMAAFGAVAYSRNHLDHNEINLMGDQSGIQAGVIATQLWNRLAVSATGSLNEVLHKFRWDKVAPHYYTYTAINYSLSTGYLLFPLEYKDYDQMNVNVYAELLGSRNARQEEERYYIDLAPSLQFIFKSTSKLNIGYRFQVAGDIYRISDKSIMISYEHLFLNGLHKKKKAGD